jgi:hypothetical protein
MTIPLLVTQQRSHSTPQPSQKGLIRRRRYYNNWLLAAFVTSYAPPPPALPFPSPVSSPPQPIRCAGFIVCIGASIIFNIKTFQLVKLLLLFPSNTHAVAILQPQSRSSFLLSSHQAKLCRRAHFSTKSFLDDNSTSKH